MKRTGKNIRNRAIPAMVSSCLNCGFNSSVDSSTEDQISVVTIAIVMVIFITSWVGIFLVAF